MNTTHPSYDLSTRRKLQGIAVGVLPGLVLAAAGTAMMYAVRASLLDPLAAHWGTSGAEGYSTFTAAVWISIALALGLPLLPAVIGWTTQPRTVNPLRDFGGYGRRIGRDGTTGFITRGGQALLVHRVGEPDLVLSVDDAPAAAAVVNTLVGQRVGPRRDGGD